MAGQLPRSMRMNCAARALGGEPLPDGSMPVGHVEDHALTGGCHGAAEQRQPHRLVVSHNRTDVHGAVAVPAESVAGEASVRALGDAC